MWSYILKFIQIIVMTLHVLFEFFLVLLPLQFYHFPLPAGIRKEQNYIFPRVAKSNRAVLPNCARGVTTYRKTFLEVYYVLFCFYKTVTTSYQAVAEF